MCRCSSRVSERGAKGEKVNLGGREGLHAVIQQLLASERGTEVRPRLVKTKGGGLKHTAT